MTGSSLREAEVAVREEAVVILTGLRGSWSPGGRAAKMKVKMLSRNPDNYVRETKLDLQRGEGR